MGDMSSLSRVIKIKDELNYMPDTSFESVQWSKRSIYRVSARLANLNRTSLINEKDYKPQLVSIGPYHYGDENLMEMEKHKRRALVHFLKRFNKPLEWFMYELAPVVQDLKDAYDQITDLKWHEDTDAFMKLMIMDGCFILEILRIFSMSDILNFDHHDYAANDPIFSIHGMLYTVPYLKRDMLMLENQMPMLVLEKLVAVQNDDFLKGGKDLTKVILMFFSRTSVRKLDSFDKCLHILDLYRKSLLQEVSYRAYIFKKQSGRHYDIDQGEDEIIRSATELIEAGIRIKRSRTRSLKDISFLGGVLKLPPIVLDDTLEPVYLNLIAFERFHVGAGNEITSYIFLMGNIICSARDVRLLHSHGIIHNALGSDEAVANLFNSLSKDITIDPRSSLHEVHKSVSYYFKRPWNKWRYNLTHNYFNNPWAIPSLVNAMCLFVLTVIQTVR